MSDDLKQYLIGKVEDVFKGLILVAWYATLLFSVSIAYENHASTTIASVYKSVFGDLNEEDKFYYEPEPHYDENFVSEGDDLADGSVAAESELTEAAEDDFGEAYDDDEYYIEYGTRSPLEFLYTDYDGQVPWRTMLVMVSSLLPDWSDLGGHSDSRLTDQEYDRLDTLLILLDAHLFSLVESTDVDISKVTISTKILPLEFTPESGHRTIELPLSVQSWIKLERGRASGIEAKRRLADTFLILIILGAFGSLIFLTNDYITNTNNNRTNIASYFFRPVFGMGLAMAMFVVDVVAHAALSNSGIEQIRNETMYLLGLSSGLIAEKAYQVLRDRATKGLEGDKPKEATVENPENGEYSENPDDQPRQ
ncbi:MAG: hypothetical protein AAF434_08190 [Pseudomonadota bacterium]